MSDRLQHRYSVLADFGMLIPELGGSFPLDVPNWPRPDAARIARSLPEAVRNIALVNPHQQEIVDGFRTVADLQLTFDRVGCSLLANTSNAAKLLVKRAELSKEDAETTIGRWVEQAATNGDFYSQTRMDPFTVFVDIPGRSRLTARALAVAGIEIFGSLCNDELNPQLNPDVDRQAALVEAAGRAGEIVRRAMYDLATLASYSSNQLTAVADALGVRSEEIGNLSRGYVKSVAPFSASVSGPSQLRRRAQRALSHPRRKRH